MNILKTLIAIFLFLAGGLSIAQSDGNDSEKITDTELSKLTKLSEEQMGSGKYQIKIQNVKFYGMQRQLLSQNELVSKLASGDYGADAYANEEGVVVVALLRKSTPEERAMMKQQREQAQMQDPSSLVGSDAKPFELEDLEGNKYSMDELKGKVVVINFWFIGCPPCRKEIPELNELVEENEDEEVVFLGVATDRHKQLTSFLSKTEFNYNIIAEGRRFAAAYNVTAYPTHIVIGKDAKVSYAAAGFGPGSIDVLKSAIEEELEK
ncbi:hypothetical protein BST97_06095 [Nonlabens spongiae]|uniref:Thioredoxin domain-containing protein n=1 Tax=Nonlabens spongiae TaxID=331648 RepID=A0A1W6MJ59_9FLAO|nr:TlpA disulfide reductase family protein [Nonlabens spongiae]ARN77597.1 hypothetical protein BST97_06095 [Nonlabens spongiae]